MKFKKGQAAMEFLMTYGWAILVVLAAIGALAYFGVLSPDRFLPSKCTLQGGFSCTEFKVSPGEVVMKVQNNRGQDLSAVNVTLTDKGASDCQPATATKTFGNTANGDFVNGSGTNDLITWTCNGNHEVGDKYQGDVDIVYIQEGESVSHTAVGSIVSDVEQ